MAKTALAQPGHNMTTLSETLITWSIALIATSAFLLFGGKAAEQELAHREEVRKVRQQHEQAARARLTRQLEIDRRYAELSKKARYYTGF